MLVKTGAASGKQMDFLRRHIFLKITFGFMMGTSISFSRLTSPRIIREIRGGRQWQNTKCGLRGSREGDYAIMDYLERVNVNGITCASTSSHIMIASSLHRQLLAT